MSDKIVFIIVILCSIVGFGFTYADQKVYQTDRYGNIQYHLPSITIKDDGRMYETDPYGNIQYHKKGYQIKDNNVYQTDRYGNIQYHESLGEIK